jgi:hypothetical protein
MDLIRHQTFGEWVIGVLHNAHFFANLNPSSQSLFYSVFRSLFNTTTMNVFPKSLQKEFQVIFLIVCWLVCVCMRCNFVRLDHNTINDRTK